MIKLTKINPDSFYIVEGRVLLAANEAVQSLYNEMLIGDDRRDRAQWCDAQLSRAEVADCEEHFPNVSYPNREEKQA
jgi:hypothetical protein